MQQDTTGSKSQQDTTSETAQLSDEFFCSCPLYRGVPSCASLPLGHELPDETELSSPLSMVNRQRL